MSSGTVHTLSFVSRFMKNVLPSLVRTRTQLVPSIGVLSLAFSRFFFFSLTHSLAPADVEGG